MSKRSAVSGGAQEARRTAVSGEPAAGTNGRTQPAPVRHRPGTAPDSAPARPAGGGPLTGIGPLVRLVLRRDRVRLPIWIAVLAVLPASTAASFAELFPSDAARAAYAAGVSANPAILSLQGPIFGSSLGSVTVARVLTICGVLVALLSILTVLRHTRGEEEAGRSELLGSTVVGRQAALGAVLAVVLVAELLLAAVVTVTLVAAGLPAGGSVATGLALAGAGWVFAGVAAVAAQLTEGTRAATGIGVSVAGAAYLLRAAGDASQNGWLSGISPFGAMSQVRPYDGERWWLLALMLALTAALVLAAFAVSARRDIAAGVLAARPGSAAAGPALAGPFGLALRLQRGSLVAWTVGFALIGAAFGGIAQGVRQLLESSPQVIDVVRQLGGGGDLVDTFLAAELGILGLVASGYAVSAALRLRTEEAAQRAEPVLATRVGRLRWATSHLVFALLGPTLVMLAAGLAVGLVHGVQSGDLGGQLPRMLAGALVQLPAVWVLAGIALALFGLAPQLTTLAWAALVAFLLLGQLGAVLRLDQWVLDLSPFTHLPQLPGGDVEAAPLLWLSVVAVVLIGVGLAGIRRRDVG